MAKYRHWTCLGCHHEWDAPVEMAKETVNISGEKTVYCPECRSRGAWGSKPFEIIDQDPVVPSTELRLSEEQIRGPWTEFHDMHSGGRQKEGFCKLFIQAPEREAISIFYSRFGHNPNRVTCTCCGEDYSITEFGDLAQATGYERGCDSVVERGPDGRITRDEYVERPYRGRYSTHKKYITLEDFVRAGVDPHSSRVTPENSIEFIYAADIKPEERTVEVPRQGYIWAD